MQELNRNQTAQSIRDVIRYIKKFHNATVVIYLDDEIIDSPFFSGHIKDIALIHQAGLKVVIVPGSRKRIDQVLKESNISWSYTDNTRITDEEAMPQIKMAAFDISNIIMTSLAANHISATIGNWVKARSKGVINGIDFGTAGDIDKLSTDSINKILDNGFIPIFPCIGWSSTGKPYNISSIRLAERIAIDLQADKLFFVMMNGEINTKNFNVPDCIGLSENHEVPAMNLDELELFLNCNKDNPNTKLLSLLKTSGSACKKGVTRSHIVNGSFDGALPCEIFSELGSGTMIYSSDYGHLRSMTQQDIPAVLRVMKPFIDRKILLPRTEEMLINQLVDYVVFEIDGGIRGCASLHIYPDNQAEIAGVAVDESFSNLGIGPKILQYLVDKARRACVKSVFIMTTQTGDWFERQGFSKGDIESLPSERKAIWTPQRNSKLFRKDLQ